MKIALLGYGKMGHMIENLAAKYQIEVKERYWDKNPLEINETNVKKLQEVDVIIDFTTPDIVFENIQKVIKINKNMIVGTTGWENHLDKVMKMVKNSDIGFVHAPNFSLGVNLFYRIADQAAKLFSTFDQYDPYIEESHHKFKKDAPSGTALKLKKITENEYENIIIPVTSVRAGYITGKHAISFDSKVDTVTVCHTAKSREGFAEGAILAAKWIRGKKGFFKFNEVIETILKSE